MHFHKLSNENGTLILWKYEKGYVLISLNFKCNCNRLSKICTLWIKKMRINGITWFHLLFFNSAAIFYIGYPSDGIPSYSISLSFPSFCTTVMLTIYPYWERMIRRCRTGIIHDDKPYLLKQMRGRGKQINREKEREREKH